MALEVRWVVVATAQRVAAARPGQVAPGIEPQPGHVACDGIGHVRVFDRSIAGSSAARRAIGFVKVADAAPRSPAKSAQRLDPRSARDLLGYPAWPSISRPWIRSRQR
jgi:hypothetical protein